MTEPGQSTAPAEPDIRPAGPIVPSANVASRALLLVIAIMTFLACLTLGAVTMVDATARGWKSEISREITVQIQASEGLDMAAALLRAKEIALETDGTLEATILDDRATARLLEPWLGAGLDLEELPVPRLVVITIDENDPPDFDALRSSLAAEIPGASLDDHRKWVDRLVAMAQTTVTIGLLILTLVFLATTLTVVFATRGALSGNRHIVEVLHFIGADSRFIASEFQRHFLRIGLYGALAGGAVAVAVFLIVSLWSWRSMATPEADQAAALFGRFAIGWTGYLGVLVVIVAIGLLTAVTTRHTVLTYVEEIDAARADTTRI